MKNLMKSICLTLLICMFSNLNYAQINDLSKCKTRADSLRFYYLNPLHAWNKDRIWIMAHRGVWDEINPESSFGAFKNAVDYGFEILELDVRFSAFYRVENNKQILDKNGTNREIILQHDKSHFRAYDDNTIVYGLFNY